MRELTNARPKATVKSLYQSLLASIQDKLDGPGPQSVGGVVLALPRWLEISMADFLINRERMNVYSDIWKMIQDSTLVRKTTKQFIYDAVAEPFTFKCDDKEATAIVNDFFERTNYWCRRYSMLFRGIALGDLFVQRNLGPAYGRRNTKIWTESIDILPEFTMFRNSNPFDRFSNYDRAFYQQIPTVPFTVDMMATKTLLPIYTIRHARWDAEIQPFVKYGCSELASARVAYNVLNRTLRYMAIARQAAAYKKDHWKLGTAEDPVIDPVKIEEWKKNNIDGKEEDVLTTYVTGGNVELDQKDPKNVQLSNVEDVKMLMDVLKVGLLYPLELLGVGVGTVGVSEGELGNLEAVMKRAISMAYQFEEYEIVRPLLEFELALHNKFVKFDLIYKPYAAEDQNKQSKRLNSEYQVGRISAETTWNLQYRQHGTWQEEEERILVEQKKGILPGGFTAGPENLNKGKKGVETKDAAAQDIPDTYATGG